MKISIDEIVKITATVVDFNEGQKTVKLKIKGISEDNHTSTEKYIRMKYEDLHSNSDFCEWYKVKNGNAYKCHTHAEIHDSRVLGWCVCPYCRKSIKIVN